MNPIDWESALLLAQGVDELDQLDHAFLDSVLREEKRGLYRKGKGVD